MQRDVIDGTKNGYAHTSWHPGYRKTKMYLRRLRALTVLITLLATFPTSTLAADQGRIGSRPVGIDKTNAQFPPNNRWAFSHVREVVPTANGEHDARGVLLLECRPDYRSDFKVPFADRT